MKKLIGSVASAIAFAGLASVASAVSFTPSDAFLLKGTDSSQGVINTKIAAYASPATLLYKSTQSDGSEEGAFADDYNTTYGTLTKASAVIAFDGPTAINSNAAYALIKDGNLGWYFYQLSGWNGTDSIDFSGYYGGIQGKISHVSIYGTHTTRTNVPDAGASVALLGLAIAGLGLAHRKLR